MKVTDDMVLTARKAAGKKRVELGTAIGLMPTNDYDLITMRAALEAVLKYIKVVVPGPFDPDGEIYPKSMPNIEQEKGYDAFRLEMIHTLREQGFVPVDANTGEEVKP